MSTAKYTVRTRKAGKPDSFTGPRRVGGCERGRGAGRLRAVTAARSRGALAAAARFDARPPRAS